VPDTAVTVPLFGVGTGTKSPNVSAQLRTNMYIEAYQEPDKSPIALFARPGLTRWALIQGKTIGIVGDVTLSNAFGGEWMVVATDTIGLGNLYRINGAGNVGALSQAAGDNGLVSQWPGTIRGASDGVKFVFTDGTNGWVTDASTNAFTTTQLSTSFNPNAISFPNGCKSMTYCASRFVADDPASPGRFRWSAAGDGTSWAALDFATAESNPDGLSCVFEANGQLLMFGTQTIEFWAPAAAGASGQLPYQRVGGANIQWGTNAIDTIRKCNDSVVFMGRNQGGNRQIVQLKGYQAQVISTADIEQEIQNDAGADAATALFYVANGHPFYILNLSDRSWVFDLRTNAWQRFSTDGGRYAAQWCQPAWGQIIVTDYRDGRLYKVDPSVYTDDGNTMIREVVSKHIAANLARLSLRELTIDCETGVGASTGGMPDEQAVTFDGYTTYINVPDIAAQRIAAPLTLEAMVQVNRLTPSAFELIRKIDAAATLNGWFIQGIGGGFRGGYNGGGGTTTTPLFTYAVGGQYRVSVVIAPATMTLYINGVPFSTVAVSGSTAPTGEPLTIGATSPFFGSANPSEFAPITISDVRIWNVARTAAQIADNAFKRLSGTEAGLLSYYKLNEGSGLIATDTKGVQSGVLTSTTSTLTLPQWTDSPFWPNNTIAQDPQLMLQWSKDGGHVYGNEVWQSLGKAGGYLSRCSWRNLGRSRDWLFKMRVTDRVKVVIIDAAAVFAP
jgi:hypothetical protein